MRAIYPNYHDLILETEVEVIYCEGNVDLEFYLIDLESVFVLNDKRINLCIAELQGFQIEAAAEGTILPVVAGLVSDDLLDIADRLSSAVREVQLIGRRFSVSTNRLLLIEVQGEDHIADLPVGGEQADLYRLRVVLAPVSLVFLALVAQEVILDHRMKCSSLFFPAKR